VEGANSSTSIGGGKDKGMTSFEKKQKEWQNIGVSKH
jgi:hypothetical protein